MFKAELRCSDTTISTPENYDRAGEKRSGCVSCSMLCVEHYKANLGIPIMSSRKNCHWCMVGGCVFFYSAKMPHGSTLSY